MKSLCVEGWRSIHHSYAMVNQWQLLSLLKREDIRLSVRDAPYFRADWQPTNGLFSAEQEDRLASIREIDFNETADATLRIAVPFDFSLTPTGRTVVFGTSERQIVEDEKLKVPFDIDTLNQSDSFTFVTPSRWSSQGFLNLGFRPERIAIVPHGVDTDLFRYSNRQQKDRARRQFGSEVFTFANASAMTGNKGIDVLLRAFAVVVQKYPDTRLLLKGTDDLYRSKEMLQALLSDLPTKLRSLVADRVLYFGDTISTTAMYQFYQAADVYVSPYRAEGFNLPVLEACACGTPVICTKGGSTDDFMDEEFTLFVDSRLLPFSKSHYRGYTLEPDLEHLIELMFQVRQDDAWRENAGHAGARHAAAKFSWDSAVNKLVDAIYNASKA